MEGITLRFVRDKETRNTFRYLEETEDGQPPRVGALYVQKWALKGLGNPEMLEVQITAG